MREYARTWTLLGSRQIEELVNQPLITDPEILDTLDVFSEGAPASFFFDEHLSSLVICRMVSSIRRSCSISRDIEARRFSWLTRISVAGRPASTRRGRSASLASV
jgi:hypothetical protein